MNYLHPPTILFTSAIMTRALSWDDTTWAKSLSEKKHNNILLGGSLFHARAMMDNRVTYTLLASLCSLNAAKLMTVRLTISLVMDFSQSVFGWVWILHDLLIQLPHMASIFERGWSMSEMLGDMCQYHMSTLVGRRDWKIHDLQEGDNEVCSSTCLSNA